MKNLEQAQHQLAQKFSRYQAQKSEMNQERFQLDLIARKIDAKSNFVEKAYSELLTHLEYSTHQKNTLLQVNPYFNLKLDDEKSSVPHVQQQSLLNAFARFKDKKHVQFKQLKCNPTSKSFGMEGKDLNQLELELDRLLANEKIPYRPRLNPVHNLMQ